MDKLTDGSMNGRFDGCKIFFSNSAVFIDATTDLYSGQQTHASSILLL